MATEPDEVGELPASVDRRAGHLSWLLLALLLSAHIAVVIGTAGGRGVPWDEAVQRDYGQAVVQWFAAGFSDQAALELRNLMIYGGTVEAGLELLVDFVDGDPYVVRHIALGLLTTLGLLAVFLLGSQLAGPWVGLGSTLILVLSPRFIGHGFFNSKDMPVAVFYLWSLVFLVRDLRLDPRRRLTTVFPLGIAVGLLLGTRIAGGIIILPMIAGYAMAARLNRGGWRTAIRYAARFSAASLTAWAVMLIGWPWAQQSPVVRPFSALLASSHFPWEMTELFQGEYINSLSLPWSYVPVWFLETLPEITLIGLTLLAIAAAVTRFRPLFRDSGAMVVALAGVVPLVVVVGTRVPLYDGLRHLLFIQPLLAIGATLGIVWFLKRFSFRVSRWLLAVLAVLCLGPLVEMIRLHPYEYIYFNHVSGRVAGAGGRMELDYWGLSYREGAEWLSANAPDLEVAQVTSCSSPISTSHFLPDTTRHLGEYRFDMEGNPDYVLFTAPQDCEPKESPVRPEGTSVYEVTREGATLLHIVRAPGRVEDGGS